MAEHRMIQCLTRLEHAGLTTANINVFFSQIEYISSQLHGAGKVHENQPMKNKSMCFGDISHLSIYYNNVRCVTNKTNLSTKIDLSVYKVLCFTETWLNNKQSSSVLFPKHYQVYRCDRSTANTTARRSGGVAVLVHNDLRSKEIIIPDSRECESVVIEIKLLPHPLILYVMYMRKFESDVAQIQYERILKVTTTYSKHRVMILGDFNIHDIDWIKDEVGCHYYPLGLESRTNKYTMDVSLFLANMQKIPLYQMSNLRNSANNALDLVFVNEVDGITVSKDNSKLINNAQQDIFHIPHEIILEHNLEKISYNETIEIRCYKKGNYPRICQKLKEIDFAHKMHGQDVDEALEYFYNVLNNLIDDNIPKIKIKKYANKPKWWTKELQRKKKSP